MGSSIPLSTELCASVQQVLNSTELDRAWSKRAVERLTELRDELSFCRGEGPVIARRGISSEWWTFAGLAANQTVVQYLQPYFATPLRADNLWISLPADASVGQLSETIEKLRDVDAPPNWDLKQPAADLLKFGDLLPEHLLRDLIMTRIADLPRAREILNCLLRFMDC